MSISICGRSSLWPFLFVAVRVWGRFGLWPFRSVAVSVCGHFGLWPFRSVAVPVCGRFGLWPFRFWPFRFVAVMTRIRHYYYFNYSYWPTFSFALFYLHRTVHKPFIISPKWLLGPISYCTKLFLLEIWIWWNHLLIVSNRLQNFGNSKTDLGLIAIYGWAMSQPMRQDFIYVTSSLIG